MKQITPENLPFSPTSHDQSVLKQVIIANGEIPHLTTLGKAGLKPGQNTSEHQHPTMTEIFYILEGEAVFVVKSEQYTVIAGQVFVIEANEIHYQKNESTSEVKWLYWGISEE